MGQISHGVLTIGCLLGICNAALNDGSSWVPSQRWRLIPPQIMMIKDGITGSSIIKWVHHDHFIHVLWTAGPDKAARQSFRGKILNARASWVVNIINFPLSSPNNSIWKIIPNNPAQKVFVDVATSKHKFYFTFPFNDKTTQFSKHYLSSSLLLIDVQNTSRGFDFKNIVQILKTQRWKPEVCTSIYT